MAEFRRKRWEAMRDAWLDWVVVALLLVTSTVTMVVASGTLQVLAAWTAGFTAAVAITGWLIGGHVSSLPWMWGATGERQTAAQLATLTNGWRVAHDVPDGRGNWDHIAIGPTGVYVIDTKSFSRATRVEDDTLRSGRIRERGGRYRGQAVRLKEALERETGLKPWVQAVVAIWGDFPQRVVEEDKVVYLDATSLTEWLQSRPPCLTDDRIARLASAIVEVTPTTSP
jgi:hypothetical protein